MVYRIRESISMNIRKLPTLKNVISPLINWLLSFAKHQIESVQLLLISEQIQFFSEQLQRRKQDFLYNHISFWPDHTKRIRIEASMFNFEQNFA